MLGRAEPTRTEPTWTRTFEFRFPEFDPDYLQRLHEQLRLARFVCIKQRWVIYVLINDGSRLCEECAEFIPNEQLVFVKHYHKFIRQKPPTKKRRRWKLDIKKFGCHRCKVRLAEIQPVEDCEACLERILIDLKRGNHLSTLNEGKTNTALYQSALPDLPSNLFQITEV